MLSVKALPLYIETWSAKSDWETLEMTNSYAVPIAGLSGIHRRTSRTGGALGQVRG